jgi:hypothetical protein
MDVKKPMKTRVCITIDTEGDAAINPNSSYLGIHKVIPRLVELLDQHGIKATFFIQEDKINQVGSKFPSVWKSLEKNGHEIGYHAHGIIPCTPEEQDAIITQGITKLRDLGLNPISYRGGRFHLKGHILQILEKNGIKFDSSVVPGLREVFKDGTERCNHLGSPKKPYFPSFHDHTKPGNSKILELPINRYPKFPPEKWAGVLGNGVNDEVLFDYFLESQKDRVIIVILHSWEYLSFKIRDTVRRDKYGRLRKKAFESLNLIFNQNFLTNGAHFIRFERILNYIKDTEGVSFATIQQAGESWLKEANE